jgi:D-serine deaminase-like pyridoxal phosphate-dependent protein
MIKNATAYGELSGREDLTRLQSLSYEDAIAIGEALLTSEWMELAEFPDDDHPMSLAIALGIQGKRSGLRDLPTGGND